MCAGGCESRRPTSPPAAPPGPAPAGASCRRWRAHPRDRGTRGRRRARLPAATRGASPRARQVGAPAAPRGRDFGAPAAPRTIARLTRNRGEPDSSSRSLQRNAIASEIRRPVTASSSTSARHFAGTSSRSRASSSQVRKPRSLNSHERPPRRRANTTASAGFCSSRPAATAASNAARNGVSALAIDRSDSRPLRPGRGVSQSTNCCTAAQSRSRTRTSRSK